MSPVRVGIRKKKHLQADVSWHAPIAVDYDATDQAIPEYAIVSLEPKSDHLWRFLHEAEDEDAPFTMLDLGWGIAPYSLFTAEDHRAQTEFYGASTWSTSMPFQR